MRANQGLESWEQPQQSFFQESGKSFLADWELTGTSIVLISSRLADETLIAVAPSILAIPLDWIEDFRNSNP